MRRKYPAYFVLILLFCVVQNSFPQKKAEKGYFAPVSVLSDGRWYKIATVFDGVYRLTYHDLIQLGMSEPFMASDFRLFGNGGALLPEKISDFRYDDLAENPVFVYDGGDGTINDGDYILFYGQSTVKWYFRPVILTFEHQLNYYSDTSFYFITFDHGQGKRIQTYPQIIQSPGIVISKFDEHVFHELDSVNLLRSGKQWFGEVFNDTYTRNFRFHFPDISVSDTLKARINVAVRSTQKSVVSCGNNGITVSSDTVLPVDGNVNSDYAKSKTIMMNIVPPSDTITINLSYNKPETASVAWLNFIELYGVRHLIYRGEQFHFRSLKTLGNAVSRFDITNMASSVSVWNITDFTALTEMPLDVNGSIFSMKVYTDSLTEFVAFDNDNLLNPILLGDIPSQNLHGSSQSTLVIVTHPDFIAEANRMADFHRSTDGMSVCVATTRQIYNEFSSGKQDPVAIRDFIRMFYERGKTDSAHQLHYVLLFGDGSYDMKDRLTSNTNFIPVWQTENSLMPTASYVSDDFYAMLDSLEGDNLNGDLDIGVGRFPVCSEIEANVMVDKSIRYGSPNDLVPDSFEHGTVSNFDPWRNSLIFVADDEDGNLHFKQAEKLITLVDSLNRIVNINKIYLDAYQQKNTPFGAKYPDVNKDIKRLIRKGTLMVNYTGHGGEAGLAAEEVVTMADIEQYENYYCLPVFITATCEFSRYDNPAFQSAGEKLLFNKKGGSIALFSTTRVAYAHSNEIVNRNILKTAFTPVSGNRVRFGDMIRKAKNMCSPGVYMQNFTLLGDPALAFAIPEYHVVTDFCGADTLSSLQDTIFNNSIVTVRGHIENRFSELQAGFDGKLFPVVYDKPVIYNTLVNDPGVSYPATFYTQQTELYRGNVTVENGIFEFSFFVPRDISFAGGYGKISYYAKSPWHDASGVFDSLCLYNDGITESSDMTGPEIIGYLDNPSFTDGSYTSPEPFMKLYLHDTSGINCFGLGIGHEITAVQDDDFNNPIRLNGYFIQDADKYTSGSIEYKFNGLGYGQHQLTIRAFDLVNNSSEKVIHFNVKGPDDAGFGKVFNYPDPFTDHTNFYIETNMSTGDQHLKISVYDMTGRMAAEIHHDIAAGNYQPVEIRWNACNAQGGPLSRGFYSYTVTLTDTEGVQKRCAEKLIILK
ncbi:MAG TPA: type IX secretion system sortase PorU [Bacteroidales bacterium]|nr:type IX secretion system sortase PorU [Bacteroidales bacterium]